MTDNINDPVVLVVDDDIDDRHLIREALEEANIRHRLMSVANGEQLLDYLLQRGQFQDPQTAPRPALILLDLNMPRLSGHEALTQISNHRSLRRIPIIVLTTSYAESDIEKAYEAGASSYICKPPSFDGLVRIMSIIGQYWLQLVQLPAH